MPNQLSIVDVANKRQAGQAGGSSVNVFVDIDLGNVDISNVLLVTRNISNVAACDEGPGMFAHFLTAISLLLVAALLPFSLVFVVKVVQVRLCPEEYSGKMECMKNQVCK